MQRERLFRCHAITIVAALATLFLTTRHAAAFQLDELPSAEQILDKCASVMGGEAAFAKITTRKITGTFRSDVAGHNLKATILYQDLAPNKRHLTFNGDAMSFVRVTDGEQVWEWQAAHGEQGETTKLMSDSTADRFKMTGVIAAPIRWREQYRSFKVVGLTKLQERPVFELRVTTRFGEDLRQFYDQENGRLVKVIRRMSSPAGDYDAEVLMEDYREFDGVWIAMRQVHTLKIPGFEEGTQVWQYEKIVHNADIAASLFELPPELKTSDKN